MKTTYLCGGINALSGAECKDWRELAKSILLGSTLDPIRRDYRGREKDHAREIVEGDLEDIDQANFLLVNATRPSWGTAMEVYHAYTHGKRSIAFVGNTETVSPWLASHVEKVVSTVEEAVDWINRQ